MQKFIIIDGNAIIHRAFYAYRNLSIGNKPTNAIFGFSSILLNLIHKEKPTYLAAAFDLKGPTFRNELFKEYKANRQKAPDELYEQIPEIHNIVELLNIPILTAEGFEADDVIGSIAKKTNQISELKTLIYTGDMDTLQLIQENVFVLTPKKSEHILYDKEAVFKKYGFYPSQVIDYKALRGDSSDNIPGVTGIGEVIATKLIQEYKTLDNIYQNLNSIKPTVAKKLSEQKDQALLSKKLATIKTDIQLDFKIDNCHTTTFDAEKVISKFNELQFKSLIKKVEQLNPTPIIQKEQMSMF